jgi:hypothetical protein
MEVFWTTFISLTARSYNNQQTKGCTEVGWGHSRKNSLTATTILCHLEFKTEVSLYTISVLLILLIWNILKYSYVHDLNYRLLNMVTFSQHFQHDIILLCHEKYFTLNVSSYLRRNLIHTSLRIIGYAWKIYSSNADANVTVNGINTRPIMI